MSAGEERTTGAVDWCAAASAVVLAFALRFVYLEQIRDIPFFQELVVDGQAYDLWAQRLAAGDWIGRGVFYQAPLYPYALGILQLVLGRDLWSIRVAQIALGSLGCGVLYFAARQFTSRPAAWVAASLLAAYPPAIFFDALIQKAVLAGFLVTLLLWSLGRLQHTASLASSLASGVVLALLSLTWENALLLAVVLPTWSIWRAVDRRRAALAAAAFVVAFLLGLAPVALRNWIVGGELALTTSQAGTNFYIGNHPGATGLYEPLRPGRSDPSYERVDATELAEEASGRRLSPGEVSRFWFGRAFAFIAAEPLEWIELIGRKWLLVWSNDEIPDADDLYLYTLWSPLLGHLASAWSFGVLCPVAVAGMVLTWPRRPMRLLHLLVLAMAASVTTFYVFARYRFPLVAPLTIFAGAALTESAALVRRGRLAPLALAASAALVAAAASHLTIFPPDYRAARNSFSHLNLALVLERQGRTDEAIVEYRAAIEAQSTNLDARQRLAPLLAARGEVDESLAQFRAVLASDPQRADARNNLGVLLVQLGRIEDAVQQFEAAVQAQPGLVEARTNLCIFGAGRRPVAQVVDHCRQTLEADPGNAVARNNLGVALLNSGRTAEAIEQLEIAVRADPSYALARQNLARARSEN